MENDNPVESIIQFNDKLYVTSVPSFRYPVKSNQFNVEAKGMEFLDQHVK